ncbi:MAG: competence protein ComE [Halobacteriovoraceae bacterium]|nr:competence protein ComE [Halobacteriovoraceae bacterium]MCB9094229.1 competence protein ComE [Halobacteriovoraceae bacterium]
MNFIKNMTSLLIISFSFLVSLTSFSTENFISHFNHDSTKSYIDPYRGFERIGDNLEEVLIKNINKAKVSVDVAVQELNLELLAKSLVEAKKRGVRVRVMLEDQYNTSFALMSNAEIDRLDEHMQAKAREQKQFVDENGNGRVTKAEAADRDALTILKNGGVQVKDDQKGPSGLMHHKFVIIDNKQMVLGSANFTRSGIHGDFDNDKTIGNANSLIEIASTKLARIFKEEFEELWRGKFKNDKSYRGVQEVNIGGRRVKVQFSPTKLGEDPTEEEYAKSVNGLILREIDTARRSFRGLFFVFSEQQIATKLEEVTTRRAGLKIEILVDRGFANQYYSELLDLWGLEMRNSNEHSGSAYCQYEKGNSPWKRAVRGGGVPNLERGDKLHHKFAVIDDRKVIVGSHNWSGAANTTNDEFIMVVEDPELAKQYLDEHDRQFRDGDIGPSNELKRKIRDIEVECQRRRRR